MDLRIRAFTDQDIEFAVAQTAREGWDNTRETFRVCLRHDPGGCFVAEVSGERVGFVTTTHYVHSAWVGNLIVAPDYRRRHIGECLMRHAIRQLEASGIRTCGLEADPMGVNIYRRLGFVERCETPRFSKRPPHQARRGETHRLCAADLVAAGDFDARFFGDHRGRLLGELLRIAHAAYCVRVNGRIEGLAMALPSASGVRIGPCVVENPATAQALIDTALSDFPDRTIIVGVPGNDLVVAGLLEARGFTRGPATLRMVRGNASVPNNPGGVVAIANGAMG
jgi:predicted N-acetyltransferase YhbS